MKSYKPYHLLEILFQDFLQSPHRYSLGGFRPWLYDTLFQKVSESAIFKRDESGKLLGVYKLTARDKKLSRKNALDIGSKILFLYLLQKDLTHILEQYLIQPPRKKLEKDTIDIEQKSFEDDLDMLLKEYKLVKNKRDRDAISYSAIAANLEDNELIKNMHDVAYNMNIRKRIEKRIKASKEFYRSNRNENMIYYGLIDQFLSKFKEYIQPTDSKLTNEDYLHYISHFVVGLGLEPSGSSHQKVFDRIKKFRQRRKFS